MDAGQAASFDVTRIGNALKGHCSRMPDVSSSPIELDGRVFVLLSIRQFDAEPVVCNKDLHDSKGNSVLRAGAIYVRTSHATTEAICTAEDMHRLISIALQRQGQSVIRQVRALLGPLPDEGSRSTTLEYDEEEESAKTSFTESKLDAPYWQVVVKPSRYIAERIGELSELRRARAAAQVSIRGWNFPHTDPDDGCAFDGGIESLTGWESHEEAHRLYRSGLFIWRRRPWELFSPGYEQKLSYLSAIWSMTEFLTFASRYANDLIPEENVAVTVTLTGIRDWQLVEPRLSMPYNAISKADRFEVALDLPTPQLVADNDAIAVKWSRRLFELFNADIAAGTIADWQTKFLNREF